MDLIILKWFKNVKFVVKRAILLLIAGIVAIMPNKERDLLLHSVLIMFLEIFPLNYASNSMSYVSFPGNVGFQGFSPPPEYFSGIAPSFLHQG